MDFFARQDEARRNTSLLVVYFLLAVFVLIVALYFTAVAILYSAQPSGTYSQPRTFDAWQPQTFGGVAVFALIIIVAGSLYKILALAGGGERVAQMMGARQVPPNTIDFKQKRLLNVVEEMALASGVPVPAVYVMDKEEGVNAFAAGYSPANAVVCVTNGALSLLDRDELQGVIAHEFSHIINGDMRLNIRLMGVLHGILLIGLIGQVILRTTGRSRGKGKGAIVLIGLAMMVIGYAGVFFGKLIKSAVARQREFLADASAVQFTRDPAGIAGALKKIGAVAFGSRIRSAHAEEASHMLFGNGLAASWVGMLATHPPLVDRIRRLEPQFDGNFESVKIKRPAAPARKPPRPPPGGGGAGGAIPQMLRLPTLAVLATSPERVADAIGKPVKEHLDRARALLSAMPDRVRAAAREPFGARAVIYALLLDREEGIRQGQMESLQSFADAAVVAETDALYPHVTGVESAARLPLVDLCMPALRGLSESQYRSFIANVDRLIEADKEISLFEYTLSRILVRVLNDSFEKKRRPAQLYALKAVTSEVSCLLTALARFGQPDEAQARGAFEAAVRVLRSPKATFDFLPQESSGLEEADRALNRLVLLAPQIKKLVVVAGLQCLVHDGKIMPEESELFRAIAEALECPLPPWLVAA